jgi:hypothetical protein
MTRTDRQGKNQARRVRRRERYDARAVLWNESHLPRVRRCGLGTNARSGGNVGIVVSPSSAGPRAGLSGVESCGSTWACPVCSEKIQATRQGEVQTALTNALAQGWSVGFYTFTVSHQRRHPLRGVWGAVSDAWRATVGGSHLWRAEREALDVAGYLRLIEVTHGANGWHVHVHCLVFFRPGVTDAQVIAQGRTMAERWRSSLRTTPYRPSKRHAGDAQVVTRATGLPDYFAKQTYSTKHVTSAAHDVTSSHSKQARRGNVTPFGILARLVAEGDARDLDLWHEWERESKGKRQLLWSNGLRAELQLMVEKTDQEIVEEDHGGAPVVHVDGKGWRKIARAGLVPTLLDLAEGGDLTTIAVLLGRSGALWWPGGVEQPPMAS